MLGALLIPRGVPLQLGLHDEKLGLGVLDRVPVLRLRLLLRLEPAGLPLEHLVDDLHARDARKDRGAASSAYCGCIARLCCCWLA